VLSRLVSLPPTRDSSSCSGESCRFDVHDLPFLVSFTLVPNQCSLGSAALNFMRKFKCLFSTCGDFDVWAEMVVGLQSFVLEGNLIIGILWCRLIGRTRGAAFLLVSFRGDRPHMPTTPGSRIQARTIRPWILSGIHPFLSQLFFPFLPLIQLIWM
jgi:hypothetical protein